MNVKTKLIISGVSVILIGLSFLNSFSTDALNFLVSTSEDMLVSLGILTDLKLAANVSHSVPLVGHVSSSALTTLDKAFNYISLANALVVAQIILLNLSKSLLFKIIGLLCIVGLFITKTSKTAYKTLIMTLLICPGIAIYINVLQYVSTEAKLNLGTTLKTELKETQDKYHSKKDALQKKIDLKHTKELNAAKAKGKTHIGLIKRIEDGIENTVSKTAVTVEEGISEGVDLIHFLSKKINEILINLIVTILIVFLVLPLLYFYIIKLALLRLFAFEINNENLQSIAAYLGRISSENIGKETIKTFNKTNKDVHE